MSENVKVIKGNNIREIIYGYACSSLPWIFPIVFLYSQNIKEVEFIEIVLPAILYCLCSLCVYLMGRLLFKGWVHASVFNIILGLILSNAMRIMRVVQMLAPELRYWHCICVFIFTAYCITFVISRKKELERVAISVISLALVALIVFNLAIACPVAIRKLVGSINATKTSKIEDGMGQKRNIYMLLCDEYASFEQLNRDFGYENGEFKKTLLDMNFNISETSKNESTSTAVVVANMMTLDYVATEDSLASELEYLTKNGRVYDILRENGYKIKGVGNTEWLGIDSELNTDKKSTTSEGENFLQIVFKEGFLGKAFTQDYAKEAKLILDSFDELDSLEIIPNSATFTFFYVCAPHHPYYLKSDGTMNDTYKFFNYDGTNSESYIGEIEYINGRLIPALRNIIDKDEDAIVLLCSDHGNRFGNVSDGMSTRTLNVLYCHGEKIDEFEGLSGVNTLRYLFNHEFNMGLPYIKIPE